MLCIRTSNGLSDDRFNTINSLPAGPRYFVVVVVFFFSQRKQRNFNDSLVKRRYKQRSRRAAAAACARAPAVRRHGDVACVEKCCLVLTRHAYSHWSMLPSAVLPSCKHRSHTQVVITGSEEWDNTKTQQHKTPHFFFFKFFCFYFFTSSSPAFRRMQLHELTDGNGVTGVERLASEGGFIYSGERRGAEIYRGVANHQFCQPTSNTSAGRCLCWLVFSFQESDATFQKCASYDCAGQNSWGKLL